MVLLINMLVDAQEDYCQQKFDVGRTRQKFHVKLKPNFELKRQLPSKVPVQLREKLEKLLTQLKRQISFVKWAMTPRWDRYLLSRFS